MKRNINKGRIIETLKREEIANQLEYIDNDEALYSLCSVFLEDIDKMEFKELLLEIMTEQGSILSDDLQDMAAGVKVGSLYWEF